MEADTKRFRFAAITILLVILAMLTAFIVIYAERTRNLEEQLISIENRISDIQTERDLEKAETVAKVQTK